MHLLAFCFAAQLFLMKANDGLSAARNDAYLKG